MEDFIERYTKIVNMALRGGIQAVPLLPPASENHIYDAQQSNKFLKACHRGYDIAQKTIIKEIEYVWTQQELSDDEKFYRELLYRKIADSIAFAMIEFKIHVGRRFILHETPIKADLTNLKRDAREADKLNSESRLTFALLADLTTFIHVCDIIRIDFTSLPKLQLIELKSGEINSVLLSQLDGLLVDPKLIEKIDHDITIPKKFKSQAKRIVKQRLRLKNIQDVLQRDVGFDTQTGEPLMLTKNEIDTDSYDRLLNDMCNESVQRKIVSGTFQYCIHIGIGNSESNIESTDYAQRALKNAFAITHQINEPKFKEIESEIYSYIEPKDYLKVFDPLKQNLYATECKPFLSWELNPVHIIEMIRGSLVILIGFDIASFVWVGRKMGFEVKLATRKKSAELLNKFGSTGVPLWNHRAIEFKIKESSHWLLSGMLLRFVNHFSSPLQFFNERAYEVDNLALKRFQELQNQRK